MNSVDFFFLGGLCGAVLLGVTVLMVLPEPVNRNVHPEAFLSADCRVGERVLMTTAPKAELYVCESHWVRK